MQGYRRFGRGQVVGDAAFGARDRRGQREVVASSARTGPDRLHELAERFAHAQMQLRGGCRRPGQIVRRSNSCVKP